MALFFFGLGAGVSLSLVLSFIGIRSLILSKKNSSSIEVLENDISYKLSMMQKQIARLK